MQEARRTTNVRYWRKADLGLIGLECVALRWDIITMSAAHICCAALKKRLSVRMRGALITVRKSGA